jgi:hypothetical protein
MKTSSGDPSERILALTNKHVASVDTTTDYEFDRANPQHILVCGDRRLARAVTEIEDAVTTGLRDVVRLAEEVEDLESKLGTPKENKTALRRRKNAFSRTTPLSRPSLPKSSTPTGKIPTAAGSVLSTGLPRLV